MKSVQNKACFLDAWALGAESRAAKTKRPPPDAAGAFSSKKPCRVLPPGGRRIEIIFSRGTHAAENRLFPVPAFFPAGARPACNRREKSKIQGPGEFISPGPFFASPADDGRILQKICKADFLTASKNSIKGIF